MQVHSVGPYTFINLQDLNFSIISLKILDANPSPPKIIFLSLLLLFLKTLSFDRLCNLINNEGTENH